MDLASETYSGWWFCCKWEYPGDEITIMFIPLECILERICCFLSPCRFRQLQTEETQVHLRELVWPIGAVYWEEGGSIKPFNSLINLQNVVWIWDKCNYGYSSPPRPHPTLLFPYKVQHLYKQLLEIVITSHRVNWRWIPTLSSRR